LDFGGAANGFDGAAELSQNSVTSGIKDATTMQLHKLLEDHLCVREMFAECFPRLPP
jgi:hypothetical protein